MQATFPLGRPAGVRVGAHWSVLLIMALLAELLAQSLLPEAVPGQSALVYWATGIAGAVVFLASLLAHELSHALVARRRGVAVDRITLWLFGGSTEMSGELPSPGTAFAVAVAGPLASLLAGGAFLGLGLLLPAAVPAVVVVALTWLGWTNLVLAVFNLLPGAPLDGGRVLQAIIWKLTGDKRRAQAAAARSGSVLGLLLAGAGLVELLWFGSFAGLWLVGIGWFLGFSARAEFAAGPAREVLGRIRLGQVMTPHPVTAPGWFTVQAFVEQAAACRQRTFPVVSFDGRPVGVVSLAALARVPEQARTSTRVEDVCVKPPLCLVAGPDVPLTTVLSRTGARPGQDLVLVVENGVLAGVVSPGDIARTLELAVLGTEARRPTV
ncbi:site-2 protease family protein [Amycolatopsis mongoliensis]|uniref:Zinc metalloprotease n=1 Tax=Amycolatopsis mongoliensis TaxID=715475 RepID=A0A9Y2JKZ8_9PSEU|nr:site-2 protease family protein [Amycolatopsis sp. 4-36]WIY00455.1 site-2 protease family protein [Amycolatopsis sp. 4-36]